MTSAGLTVSHDGDACIGTVTGEVDFSNARELGDDLLRQVANDAAGLVLDLSAVRYVDSSGVALVFRLSRSLSTRRQRLVIALPDDSPIRKLFAVTAIDSVATVASTAKDARAALAEAPDVA